MKHIIGVDFGGGVSNSGDLLLKPPPMKNSKIKR